MTIYRCYAEGRPGDWEAICLDLDIAVQGHSLPEVFDSLEKAVTMYLEEVAKLPEAEQAALLDRRAPLSCRLRFLWFAFLAAVRSRTRDGDGPTRAEFIVAAAA